MKQENLISEWVNGDFNEFWKGRSPNMYVSNKILWYQAGRNTAPVKIAVHLDKNIIALYPAGIMMGTRIHGGIIKRISREASHTGKYSLIVHNTGILEGIMSGIIINMTPNMRYINRLMEENKIPPLFRVDDFSTQPHVNNLCNYWRYYNDSKLDGKYSLLVICDYKSDISKQACYVPENQRAGFRVCLFTSQHEWVMCMLGLSEQMTGVQVFDIR